MHKNFKMIMLGFILVIIVFVIGNLIHQMLTIKSIDYDNKDAYIKQEDRNLSILIEVDKKLLYVIDLDTNEVVKKFVVATGKPGTPTPLGTFKVVEKARWGGGFGSRWLGLNVPWGRYGIHGTNRPGSIGYNASGGCIRMRNSDVEELYPLVKYDTTVSIVSGNSSPFGYGVRILRPGDRGSDVQEVQKRLKQKGYYDGSIDGIYGEGTKFALIRFLKDNNLPITDNIGPNIYEKLNIIFMD